MYASEMTPADIAACTGGNNNDGFGFGGNGAWWIIILLLFGWGRNGFGGGSCGCGGGCATQADVRAAVDQQTLISKIDQQTYGMADSFTALTANLNSNFRGIDNALCTLGYQTQQGFNALSAENAKCCCETQRLIERGFCDTNNTLHNTTRDIIDNQNCNARAILDALTAQRIADKDAKIAEQTQTIFGLQLAASQAAQNNYLINQLRPCPVPAYITCNPYAASYGFGASGSCGCGCGVA